MNTESQKFNLKQRDYSLDLLKILAIIFVTSYHFAINGLGFEYVQSLSFNKVISTALFMINTLCIPLFLIVNGALLLGKSDGNINIKKHIKKCVIMLITLYIWTFITILIIGLYKHIDLLSIRKKDWINAIFFFRQFPGVDLSHLWFIPMLLSLYFIYQFILHFMNNNNSASKYLIIFICVLLVFMVAYGDLYYIQKCIWGQQIIDTRGLDRLSPFRMSIEGYLFYFILGGVIYRNKEKFTKIKWYILLPLFFIGLVWLFVYWRCQKDYWDYIFGGYNLLPTVLMTVCTFVLFLKFPNEIIQKNKVATFVIEAIGGNTLTIYYTHWILGYTLLYKVLPHIQSFNIWTNLLKAIIFVLIGATIGWLLKKIPKIGKYIN